MRVYAVLAFALLTACGGAGEEEPPVAATPAKPPAVPQAADILPTPGGAPAPAAPQPQPDAPEIYMALQKDNADIVSVIFAIDEARDNTPSDDPAIRITPEGGLCNPQQLRRFEFPGLYAARPVYSRLEAERPVEADQLPSFLATTVTTEMVRQGLARTPDDTRPQNMCTYLLWERLVYADLRSQLAGQ
ncbi:MAG: hypothetical protein AAFR79_20720 [Pseudomonadota bacterium]